MPRGKLLLFDGDFGAGDGSTGERPIAALLELYGAVPHGVDRIVAAEHSAYARALAHTDLADDDLAGFDFLTTK